jgi:hypothetical protein
LSQPLASPEKSSNSRAPWLAATHAPPWQDVSGVQPSSSSHAAPSGLSSGRHAPLLASHRPAVHSLSNAVQSTISVAVHAPA